MSGFAAQSALGHAFPSYVTTEAKCRPGIPPFADLSCGPMYSGVICSRGEVVARTSYFFCRWGANVRIARMISCVLVQIPPCLVIYLIKMSPGESNHNAGRARLESQSENSEV